MIELRYPARLVTPEFSRQLAGLFELQPDGRPHSKQHEVHLIMDELEPGGRRFKRLALQGQMTESAAYSLVVRGVDVRVLDDSIIDDVKS